MEGKNVHYSEGQWIDFVRGLTETAAAREMQTHLGSNCADCQALVDSLSVVERTAFQDRALPVPTAAIARAMAIFRPAPRVSFFDLPRVLAEIVFDSRHQPLLAGVRKMDPQVRHVVFRSSVLQSEVQLEVRAPKRILAVTGQLSTPASDELLAKGMRVALTDGQLTLAEAPANEFGEFELECSFQRGLQLVAWSPQGPEAVVMDLDGVLGNWKQSVVAEDGPQQ